MTSPYSLQQLEKIQEMQRQQIHQLNHQMRMSGLMNANCMNSPVMLPVALMLPGHATHNMSQLKPLDIGSPPIVVVESEEDEEDDEELRTLFVANLDERVTEELLYEIFVQTGPIDRVRIPKDNTGRQRTFGFITFAHRCSPPYAMHLLQGLSLYRKTLTIKFNGKNFPPPMKSPILTIRHSNDKTYDNSALRSGNFSSYNDNKRMNMDKTPSSSSRHQDRLSKHSSTQMRPHSNSSPYLQQQQQRRDSPNHYNDNRRYHNNHNNNGNSGNKNRYSDHRGSSGGGKYRR